MNSSLEPLTVTRVLRNSNSLEWEDLEYTSRVMIIAQQFYNARVTRILVILYNLDIYGHPAYSQPITVQ